MARARKTIDETTEQRLQPILRGAFSGYRSRFRLLSRGILTRQAFRTSDWEIPNCRAICDGVTPALKAARTAFSFPTVNGTPASPRRLRELSSGAGDFLPRRR